MKDFINHRPEDEHNKFTEVKETNELFRILELLKTREGDLQNELYSYEGDDKYAIENEYNLVLRDKHQLEQEIKRRADNN